MAKFEFKVTIHYGPWAKCTQFVGWMQEGRKWHFWQNWVFDGIWKYRFIRTFCTIFKVLSPFIFQNIKQNVFKICHLRPYCTNIWQMCLMQEDRKGHLRPSCTNFRQMCVMQERHKCHLRPSCIKQLILTFWFTMFWFYTHCSHKK